MKYIEGAFVFICITIFAIAHLEMTISGNGWKIDEKTAADPWYVDCLYYRNFHVFTYHSSRSSPCTLRMSEALATKGT
jgi:hypothetical protein